MAALQQSEFLPFGVNSTPTFVLAIVAASLIVAITLIKVWVSKICGLKFFLSDKLAVFSSAILVASLGLVIYYNAAYNSNEDNISDMEASDASFTTAYLKAAFAVEILWPASLCLSKLSVLLLFRRVFFSRRLRVLVSCMMIYVVLLYLAVIIGTVLQCLPVDSFWRVQADMVDPPACFNRQLFFLLVDIPNAVANAIILGLPVYEIRRLNIGRMVKNFLWSILILGCFALGASIARFVEIARIGGTSSSQAQVGGGAAVVVEASLVILCAYLPTLCPALWLIRPIRGGGIGGLERGEGGREKAAQPGGRLQQRMQQRLRMGAGQRQSSWRRLLPLSFSSGEHSSNTTPSSSRFTRSRRWPRSRSRTRTRPRPYSEFIDPTKPLPREPRNAYMEESFGSLPSMMDSSLGGIRVEETVTTTVERRSRLFGPEQGVRAATGLGPWVDGPNG